MKSVVFGLILFMSGLAHSFTGNDLYNELRDNDPFAMGYVTGVTKMLVTFGEATSCITAPDGVNAEQVVDIVRNYLRDNPDVRHISAELTVSLALMTTFGASPKPAEGMC